MNYISLPLLTFFYLKTLLQCLLSNWNTSRAVLLASWTVEILYLSLLQQHLNNVCGRKVSAKETQTQQRQGTQWSRQGTLLTCGLSSSGKAGKWTWLSHIPCKCQSHQTTGKIKYKYAFLRSLMSLKNTRTPKPFPFLPSDLFKMTIVSSQAKHFVQFKFMFGFSWLFIFVRRITKKK